MADQRDQQDSRRFHLPKARGGMAGDHNIQVNLFSAPPERSVSDDTLAPSSPGALEVLRASVNKAVSEQVRLLTNRGFLVVPWSLQTSGADGLEPTADMSPMGDDRLGDLVAGGGQLIVVGESQSGKTTLATRMVKLIADRTDKQPVVFTLATWNPRTTRLKAWMLDVLRSTSRQNGTSQVAALAAALEAGEIIPVFDGFDEIDAAFCGKASQAINLFVDDRPAVLTGIPRPSHSRALYAALPGAEIIELAPVEASEVARYLLNVPKPERTRWRAISAQVEAEPRSSVAAALSSPLIAWLTKSVYATGPEPAALATARDATELLDEDRFPTPAAIENHLLGSLVTAVFGLRVASPDGDLAPVNEFPPQDAKRWLSFLSEHAVRRIIAFWEIRYYAPLYRLALAAAALAGVTVGLLNHLVPRFAGTAILLSLAGLCFGFGWARGYAAGRARGPADPARAGYARGGVNQDGDMRSHALRLAQGLLMITLGYAVCRITMLGLDEPAGWLLGLSPAQALLGAALATPVGVGVGILGGRIAAAVLRAAPWLDAKTGARTADPLVVIHNDRRSGIGLFLLACVILAVGYLVYYVAVMPLGFPNGIYLVPVGASVAMFFWNEWACYKVAHLWLLSHHLLPWRFEQFLQTCHDGGILRKNGNHFEFRHQRLQDCLAESYPGRGRTRRKAFGHRV
ncbi:hypothetical protein ACIBVK_21410 [Micromonospora echinofusca]|uniref:hypothetical protein n=1 Tax=Micromonospora echinofusca TaxID=47858 RepID=UPI0037B745F6